MKLNIALLAVPLILVGCATSKPIQGPNGTTAYFIKCGSAAIDSCYQEAAKVCPKGYTMADKNSNPNAVAMPMTGGGFMMARGPNTMLIECKP